MYGGLEILAVLLEQVFRYILEHLLYKTLFYDKKAVIQKNPINLMEWTDSLDSATLN